MFLGGAPSTVGVMNTLTPALAALATLVLPLASPAAAAPADSVMVCTRSGHVSLSPGVIATEAKDFTFTEWGEFSNCNGPGGLSATFEHDVGTGSGQCGLVVGSIPQAPLRWSNGQASVISAEATIYGALSVVTGKVLSGQFAGARLLASAILTPADPSGCLGSGLSESDYVGEIRFDFLP